MPRPLIGLLAPAALGAPTDAVAQSRTTIGVGTGAVAGAVVGGPIGAVVGGVAGGFIGSSYEPRRRYQRVRYVRPRYVRTRSVYRRVSR